MIAEGKKSRIKTRSSMITLLPDYQLDWEPKFSIFSIVHKWNPPGHGFSKPLPGSLWMICMNLNRKPLLISSLLNMRLMSPFGGETISWHPLSWIGQFDTVHTFYIWINKGIWMESSTAGSFGCICPLLTLLLTQYYQHMFVTASWKDNQTMK